MNTWAKPSVKCVCLEATGDYSPKVNEICMIERVFSFKGETFLNLVGYGWVQTSPYEKTRYGFPVYRFRPVAYPSQSLEHDLAKFRQISRHVPAPEKEAAE